MTAILLYLLVCYLAGSVPFGFAAGLLAGHDVRREGSGNIGFTNVLRVCGKRWGFPVLLLDAFKGFAPVFWLAPVIMAPEMPDFHAQQALGGLMAIIGHSFPVWLRFWDGDDEFPPQLGVLWDANSLSFMHYETLWYVFGALREEILRELK